MSKSTSTIYLRNRKAAQGNPVSLFPFLAVLICTMGTLILLLIVIVESARTHAAEQNDAKTDQVITQLQIEAESAEVMAKDLAVSKEKTIADIENQRAKLAVLENGIEKMIAEIKRTENVLQDLEKNKGSNNAELSKISETLATKKAQLQQAEVELSKLQKEEPTQQKSYAIIPFRGANGTHRRPIYIECRSDCVIIQPEGIVFKEEDFLTASHPDNPLDAVLRSASLYYTENNLVPQGSRPYPLILVRSDGIDSYYAARESIKSWGDQFGYELVNADWKLEFPQPNEALKQRLETQLLASRERMIPFKTMLLQRYAEAGGKVSGRRGTGNETGGDGMSYNSANGASQSRSGSTSQGTAGQQANGSDVNWKDVAATVGNTKSATRKKKATPYYRVKPSGGVERVDPDENDVDNYDNTVANNKSPNALGNDRNRQSGTNTASTQNTQATINGNGGYPDNNNLTNNNLTNNNLTNNNFNNLAYNNLNTNSNPSNNNPSSDNNLDGYSNSGYFNAGGGNLAGNTGTPSPLQNSQGYPSANNAMQNNVATFTPAQPQVGVYGNASQQGDNNASLQNNCAAPSFVAPDDTSQNRAVFSQNNTDSTNNANSTIANTETSQQSGWLQGAINTQSAGKSNYDNMQSDSQMSDDTDKSTARERRDQKGGDYVKNLPRNWSMPNVSRGSTEIVRPIILQCQPDKIVFKRSAGRGIDREIGIPNGNSLNSVGQTLVSSVLDYTDTWGSAGQGMHWQPELNVTVQPGAEQRFEELKVLLQGSGMRLILK